jgi:hypothetical protein
MNQTWMAEGDIPVLPECVLSLCFDLLYPLHGFECGSYQLSIVSNRYIPPLFEFECRVLWISRFAFHHTMEIEHTITISLPFARLKALVHLTFLGFLFALKFL